MGWDVNLGSERIGEKFTNTFGTVFEIVEYTTANDLVVRFLDGHNYETHATYQSCKKGNCKNPFDRTILGVGYLGLRENGTIPPTQKIINGKKKHSKEYIAWYNMINRCYNKSVWIDRPEYKNCFVDEKLQCFAYFLDHVHEIEGYELLYTRDNIELDKDIKVPGNKIYSIETCMFVTRQQNTQDAFKRARARANTKK